MNVERAALKLLKALNKENLREPNLLKCKRAGEIGQECGLSQEEYIATLKFLVERKLLNCVNYQDGLKSCQPSPAGIEYLKAADEKVKLGFDPANAYLDTDNCSLGTAHRRDHFSRDTSPSLSRKKCWIAFVEPVRTLRVFG